MKFVIVFAALLAIAVALPRDAAEGDAEIANGLLSLITSVVKQKLLKTQEYPVIHNRALALRPLPQDEVPYHRTGREINTLNHPELAAAYMDQATAIMAWH
ncbi:hypothetical protein quinque_002442 [Culex quinquefasciatus]